MKKLLTAASIVALTASNTFAAEDMFYLKADGGVAMFSEVKDANSGLKVKSKTSGLVSLGAGYYVMDNLSVGLDFTHFFNPEFKKTASGVSAKHSPKIEALMLNTSVDVVDVSVVKFFMGLSVGAAQLKEKVYYKDSVEDYSTSVKSTMNIAYGIHLGAKSEVAPGIHLALTSSWLEFGKTKSAKDKYNVEVGKNRYRTPALTLGVRFDM